jgi:hypothetical protein
LVSLVAKLVGIPFPLVMGLAVVRSRMFRRSVRWAYVNRDLATRSGRVARKQSSDINYEYL